MTTRRDQRKQDALRRVDEATIPYRVQVPASMLRELLEEPDRRYIDVPTGEGRWLRLLVVDDEAPPADQDRTT